MNKIMIAIFAFCLIKVFEAQSKSLSINAINSLLEENLTTSAHGLATSASAGSCCHKKIVQGSTKPEMDGTYTLIPDQPHMEIPANCSNSCIYVKDSEVMNLMGDNTTSVSMGKVEATVSAQKYCFQPSESTNTMCSAEVSMETKIENVYVYVYNAYAYQGGYSPIKGSVTMYGDDCLPNSGVSQKFEINYVFGIAVLEFKKTGLNCIVYQVDSDGCTGYTSNDLSYNPNYLYQVNGILHQNCEVTATTRSNGPAQGQCEF